MEGFFDPMGEVAVLDHFPDVGEMAFGGIIVDMHIDLGGGEAVFHDFADIFCQTTPLSSS